MNFDTGYVGAHRWHVEFDRNYKWTCICGAKGSIATTVTSVAFVQECFARHAHDALQAAAVDLLSTYTQAMPDEAIEAMVGYQRRQGSGDKANLLQLVVNRREDARMGDDI